MGKDRGAVTVAGAMTRAPWLLLILALLALAWQSCQRRAEGARADREATEVAALKLRELGWQTTLAEITRHLPRRLPDTVATVLRQARAQPIARTEIQATATGSTEARQDSVASGPDSTVYRISDPVLSGSVTVWVDSAVARVDWTVRIGLELVQAVGADGRLLSMVRADDPRVVPVLRSVEWEPPRMSSPSRWDCALSAGGTGAAAATGRWGLAGVGVLATVWRCS